MSRVLDIDLLRSFHAVARFGRFNTAADHLGKSTSAVSVHIRRLEEIAGARLLERDNQGVVLTPRGRQFILDSMALLAEHDRLLAALGAAPLEGRVRFGIPEEYAGRFVGELLPLFAVEHPGVELDIEVASSETLSVLFDRQRLDAVVTVTPGTVPSAGALLSEARPVWVAGKDFRALSNPVLPLALHATGCPYREAAITALKEDGRCWRPVVSTSNSEAITRAVAGGFAVALMDRGHLPEGLLVVPERFGLPQVPTCRIVYRSHEGNAAQGRLGDALRLFFRAKG